MGVVLSVVVSSVVVGVAAWFAARRWPEVVEEPHLSTHTIQGEVETHAGLALVLRRRTDPRQLTGLALTVALLVILGAAAGIGLLLAMIHGHTGLARWDLRFARFGADHASSGSTAFLRDVSQLGGTIGVISIALVVAAIEYRRLRSRAVVGYLVVVVAGQFALSNGIKVLVGRKRPNLLHLTGFSSSSFPSGHATAASATLMACAFLIGRRRPVRRRAVLAGLAAALAAAVAASRVLLGVHWFTDVLAGLLLGWAWFAMCSIAFGGPLLRFGAPARQAERIADSETSASAGRSVGTGPR